MEIVTKDFTVLDGDATAEHPYGSFEVVLSAPTLDRDGEVIDSRAFEPLPEHITFDTDHSMTCDSVVGSGAPSYADDGTLRVKGGYCQDERSQTIRQKVKDGHIRTTSVTFMAADREPDEKGVVHIKRAELLNGTFTPVPSNREAVVLSAKSILAKTGARNNATDTERLQQIHDLAVSNGASCEGKTVEDTDNKTVETPEVETEDTRTVETTAEDAPVAAKAATETSDAAGEGISARMALLDTGLEL